MFCILQQSIIDISLPSYLISILALWIEILFRGMLEFTSYNKLIYKLLRSLTEFYELVTAIWFVETLCCHLTHITSTSDAENMKLPKQEYAGWPATPGPWHHSNNTKRTLLRKLENNKDNSSGPVGRSWHFVIFSTFLELRAAAGQRLGKQTISQGRNQYFEIVSDDSDQPTWYPGQEEEEEEGSWWCCIHVDAKFPSHSRSSPTIFV